MFNKALSTLVVSTELYQVQPLQHYIGYLARHCQIPEKKLLHLEILIEEVFTHIVSEAFCNRPDGEITITASVNHAAFVLQFHYLGMPFGYNMERIKDDQDEISLHLIKQLSSSYSMRQQGKEGQTVEINIALPAHVDESLYHIADPSHKITLATDNVVLREIEDTEMEMLVQCLYNVFGYTYSADGIYYPEVILERKHQGVYRGFVGINEAGIVVAHVAMLKESADAWLCESGQAFVSPQYGKRGLFNRLKKELIQQAELEGLHGVMSSAVTGHSFTQKANIALGCTEVGLELSYIPANLKSVIPREGEQQRQSVLSYFYCTSHQEEQSVYAPPQHRAMIEKTYHHLGLRRTFIDAAIPTEFKEEKSEVTMTVKTEWNQLHIHIEHPGRDLSLRIRNILRQSAISGIAVTYLSLPLTSVSTLGIVNILERIGFYYAGVMPYELGGNDSIRMQYLTDNHLMAHYIIAESDWGKEIKKYVFECKEKQDNQLNTFL
ncbi:MAG: hypothetical protein RR365_09665 [Bacteroides sp.]